jgi:hypothetical protein
MELQSKSLPQFLPPAFLSLQDVDADADADVDEPRPSFPACDAREGAHLRPHIRLKELLGVVGHARGEGRASSQKLIKRRPDLVGSSWGRPRWRTVAP